MRNSSEIHSQFNLVKVSLMAVLVGILAGVTAKLLHDLIGLVTHIVFYGQFKPEIVSPLDSPLGILIIFVPAIGGLIVGAMAKWGTPLVRGHGIPEAMEAILKNKSRVSPKVALLKPLSAAVSIGSGQPFGAEGPIIQTGGALGSVIGQMLHMTVSERKVLLACGAAGGLAATFNTPIAAIVFAIELLLFEFRTRSFIPLAISCTIASGIYIQIFGAEPIFSVPATTFGHPLNLIFFLFLGVICGGVGIVLTRSLYWIEDIFHHSSINTYLHPAIGGLFVGIVGYLVPTLLYPGVDIFGPGYYLIENILNAQYPVMFLIILLIAKSVVWLVSVGSGTSGGTLAPIFMIGAVVGSLFGTVVIRIFPAIDIVPLAFAMAGMAAVFGSSTNATFASVIFVFEITQSYESILPVLITSVIADAIVTYWLPTSILTEQLRRAGILVHQEYETNVLNTIPVSSVMDHDPVIVPETMPILKLIEGIKAGIPELTRHYGIFVVNDMQELTGIVTRSDILRSLVEADEVGTVNHIARQDIIITYPDEPVEIAMARMLRADIGRLPVVSRENPRQIIGYLSRANVIEAHLQRLQDETLLEAGWLSKRFSAKH